MISDDPSVIAPTLAQLRQTFLSGKTRPMEFRKSQLRQLLRGLEEMDGELNDALEKDLGVRQFSGKLLSTMITKMDIEHTLAHMDSWNKAKSLDTPMVRNFDKLMEYQVLGPGVSKLVYEPLGVALVLGAWNYPVYISLTPLIGVIAAGNCAVVKPSELAPHSSNVMSKLVQKYLDQDCYRVIEGAIEVASKICYHAFDLIIFTGSSEKGKLIAKAAAENLVPCILELGGKSPTIVDSGADLDMSAQRIVQARFTNSGQTCVACDYILVHESMKEALIAHLRKWITNFYGQDPMQSADYSRVITSNHTQRLVSLLDVNDHKGNIVCGGKYDVQQRYIAPTIIDNPALESKVMNEEIFGPILPVLTFKHIKEAINFINARPKPLALYYFGNNTANRNLIEQGTSSGAFVSNDALFYLLSPFLPFGGVGNSGYSAYHGVVGFRNCSHAKPVFHKSTINFFPFNQRYPPFTSHKQRILLSLFKLSGLTQKAVLNGVIVIGAILGLGYLQKTGQIRKLAQKAKPYLDDFCKEAPSL